MVVCKYFQQGNCRFGQDCRFEHIYGSKYNYHANQSQSLQSGTTDEQLINQVQSDIQSALMGGQWILSAYAPFKGKPTFPGMIELSPEEARLYIYEARKDNNVDQMVEYINKLFKEARLKHEMLLQPTPDLVKVFRSLYKGEIVPSPFGYAMPSTNSNATSIFRSAVQNTSIFGQNTNINSSIFSQKPSNVFETQNESAQSIFSQANQNVFRPSQTNVFGPNQTANSDVFGPQVSNNVETKSIFAQANQTEAKSIFAQANQNFTSSQTQSNNVVGPSNPFAQMNQPLSNQTNVFQTTGKNVFEQQIDDNVYSKMDELSPDNLKAFESDDFELGFVPEVPPPQVLCF